MVNIDLGDGLHLRSYEYGWEICKMRGGKDPGLVPFKYYTSLNGAVHGLVEQKLRRSTKKSLKGLCHAQTALVCEIRNVLGVD